MGTIAGYCEYCHRPMNSHLPGCPMYEDFPCRRCGAFDDDYGTCTIPSCDQIFACDLSKSGDYTIYYDADGNAHAISSEPIKVIET